MPKTYYVRCSTCGTRCSPDVILANGEGDMEFKVRAHVECPECISKRLIEEQQAKQSTVDAVATTGGKATTSKSK